MLLLVRPAAFSSNAQTAVNNHFQPKAVNQDSETLQELALREFDALTTALQAADIAITVIQDSPEPHTPDSIFPNNWISFHPEGYVLYPMFAPNRRLERQLGVLAHFPDASCLLDLSPEEQRGHFLEGTGSLVLDRTRCIAYAAISARTHPELVSRWCRSMGYTPIMFHAMQTVASQRQPIYHTNVMMSIGDEFALWCPNCIDQKEERNRVEQSLQSSNKTLITINEIQMHEFAGNILQVHNRKGEAYILMSASAEAALRGPALDELKQFGSILSTPIPTIEKYGGGSVRCMVAEVG